MGVSQLNNSNNVSIIKLALARQTAKGRRSNMPAYLTNQGSIFNAPGVNNNGPKLPTTRDTLAQLNTNRSLSELNKKPQNSPTVLGSSSKGSDDENQFSASDAASGKEAITKGKEMTTKTQAFTKKAEDGTKSVTILGREGQKLEGTIAKSNQKFEAQFKADQAQLDKDNKDLIKNIKEAEDLQVEILNAQNELDMLNFSAGSNSTTIGGTGNTGNNTRATELQTFIGSKVGKLQQNGKMIYSLQRNQSRTYSRMQRTNARYVRASYKNTKAIESKQNSESKIIKIANEVEKWSAIASTGGQLLGIAGEGLIALGGSMGGTGFGAAVGAALIAVGKVMKVGGSVLELAGNYGQAAANITKTAAYAAEGNLMGAMMSAASAVQSGTAAVKSTQTIGKDIKATIQQANDAKAKIAATQAAKAEVNNAIDKQAVATKLGKDVKDVTQEDISANIGSISRKDMKAAQETALGGMSKREAKKYVRADIRAKISEEGLTKIKSMRNFASSNAGESLNSGVADFKKAQDAAAKKLHVGNTYASATSPNDNDKKLFTLDDKGNNTGNTIKKSKVNKLASKNFKNTISEKNVPKISTGFGSKLERLGSGLTSMAAMFAQNNALSQASTKKNPPQWQMDARTQRIMARNQAYRRHAAYV